MSRVINFPTQRPEQEQAATWIVRLDRGLRGDEREQLRAWLARAARHRSALLQAARLWDHMDMLAELAELFPLQEEAVAGRWRGAVAAAALLVVSLGMLAVFFASGIRTGDSGSEVAAVPVAGTHPAAVAAVAAPAVAPVVANYTTAVGEQRTVTLPDHSTIRLNTNTALHVEFTASARLLKMTRGEASFQVAKDPARVFTVRVAGIDFNAIGTAFNIRADWPRGVRLTVTEGRVRVRRASEDSRVGASWSGMSDSTDVEANREVVIGKSGERMAALEPAQVAAATAWQHGMVLFEATPLRQVVSELGRYSTTRFVIVDEALSQVPVTGYFKIGDVDALSAALEHNFGIVVEKNNNTILLSAHATK